ncbi:MAG: peptidoglycan-binding protein [Bacillota bacterium]
MGGNGRDRTGSEVRRAKRARPRRRAAARALEGPLFLVLGLLSVGLLAFQAWSGFFPGPLPTALGVESPTCHPGRVLVLRDPPLRGGDVAELQAALRQLGLYGGPVDGVFLPATGEAVAALRARHGLTPVARVDPAFWRALAVEWHRAHPGAGVLSATSTEHPEGELLIVINIEERRLTLYADGYPFKSYPVAVGTPWTPSQPGQWRIRNKGVHLGPQFGSRWMGLSIWWGSYGVHGTNNPGSIGSAASGGCIRMFNYHVEELYEWVPIGTPVHIVSPHWLASVPPLVQNGWGGLAVVFLQWQMQRLGFDPGEADGRFGEATDAAVRNLEAFYGLNVDGVVDTDVLCLLDLDR